MAVAGMNDNVGGSLPVSLPVSLPAPALTAPAAAPPGGAAGRRLRYVELVAIDPSTTAVQTASRAWYRVAAPLDDLASAVRSLDTAGTGGTGGAGRPEGSPAWHDLRASIEPLLVEGGSLVPVRPAGAPALILTGDPALCDRLRRAAGDGPLGSAAVLDLGGAAGPPPRPGQEVVVVARDRLDGDSLRAAAERCAGHVWAPFALDEGRGWFGPLFVPGDGPDVDDYQGRLVTAAAMRPWRDGTPGVRLGAWVRPTDADLAWMAAVIGADVARYLDGEDCLSRWHELELDPAGLGVIRHLVLPLPLPPDPERYEPLAYACDPDRLVDPRTGVVTRLRRIIHHPSIPRELITVHAHVAAMRRIGPWLTDPVAAGTSFESEAHARQASIGEAVERYCGDIVRPDLLRVATWSELAEAGEHAVDPDQLVLFSGRQHARPGFPFVPLTRSDRVHWVSGRSLTGGRPAWLPASLAYGNWHTGPFKDIPPTNNPFYPGLAAGPNLEFALAAGIAEVVERHATMVWWANAQPLPAVRPSTRLAALWSGRPDQRAWLVALDNEFGVPVLAGVVEHRGEQLFTMGFAARHDPEAAALKAWAEALTLQDGARDLLDPDGGYRQSAGRGEINSEFIKPWRADRRYLDDYRPDFRDAVDLMCQVQIHLDPRAPEVVRPWVDTAASRTLEDLPRLPEQSLDAYRAAVEGRGYEIFYADITTRDVACTGMRVVRVLIPGLVPNFAAAFPFHGRGRLRDVAVELGWRSSPLAEDEINVFPMPHA
jgi:ribosomal protein S12 methylthiotransferase accessory factor